jgi:hypothetical protein
VGKQRTPLRVISARQADHQRRLDRAAMANDQRGRAVINQLCVSITVNAPMAVA